MSWVVSSMFLMAVAVLVGIVWYERSRPTARTVALIATLAGLASLGRIAFAPLPSIKPTTDIVLLSGYALGGAPGFMVGITAAFAANFFFGQGPWTLWQMFAWGAIGISGGVIARFSRRRLGRWQLVIACALAGVLFSLIVNFAFWVTFAGDHTLGTLLTYYMSAIPFDFVHVVGNVAFCFLFGPELVKILERYRLRSKVRWHDQSLRLGDSDTLK